MLVLSHLCFCIIVVGPCGIYGASGREEDADALQDSIRATHVEEGMSGACPRVAGLEVGSLAAMTVFVLATSRGVLPGEGQATKEM